MSRTLLSGKTREFLLVMRGLKDILYPNHCVGCNASSGRGLPLCPFCERTLPWVDPADVQDRMRKAQQPNDVPLQGRSGWIFDKKGHIQVLHQRLKFGGFPHVGFDLAVLMAHAIDPIPPGAYMVPIPLHRLRQLERGYNQSDYIAEGLATAWHCAVRNPLERHRFGRSQTGKGRTLRARSLDGAFVAAAAAGQPWDVNAPLWLVDDILTTGSTLWSAARTLRQAGYRVEGCLTLGMART